MAIFKKALQFSIFALLAGLASPGFAEYNKITHLNTGGQSKVNRVVAQGFMQRSSGSAPQSQTLVNVGSNRAGTCTMNIGTSIEKAKIGPGTRGQDIIVTAKEIINVCGR
jgi:hypothetical protein